MLANERRITPMARWRLRVARGVTTSAAAVLVAAWTLTTGASYSLVSHFVHMRPVTAVSTSRPEVGLLVDVPVGQVPGLAVALGRDRVHASFAVSQQPTPGELQGLGSGDQAIPRLGGGGVFRWLETGDQLHRLNVPLGIRHGHFLYASSGPSFGQWLLAKSAGGRLVGGAIHLSDPRQSIGRLRMGEVVEVSAPNVPAARAILAHLCHQLRAEHLRAVSLSRLMHDAGVRV
jgi:hypothetical protein